MAHWETATRGLQSKGGGPLRRTEFDGDFETDIAAIAGARRAKELGLMTVQGPHVIAKWTLTQRGWDWCDGLVCVVTRSWQCIGETPPARHERVARLVSDSAEAFSACAILTARQIEILVLIAKGFTRQEIATRLRLKPKSVMERTARIVAALGCTRSIEAAVIAAKAGIA